MPVTETAAFAVWLTGLPASGKTTIARHIESQLADMSINVQILDSDEMREILTPQPAYTSEERDWFYATLVTIAKMLVDNGVPVLIAATANRRRYRDAARERIARFMEVYIDCPLATCQTRDYKGTYEKATSGEAATVPGIGAAYEVPLHPELTLNTVEQAPDDCAAQVIAQLRQRRWLPR